MNTENCMISKQGQRFFPARFGRYMRLYCATNRSFILSYYLIMLIGMTACEFFIPVLDRFSKYKQDYGQSSDEYCIIGMVLCGVFGAVMLMEGGRRMYNRMRRLDFRNTLMVPASLFEKAAVWFIVWILGSWIAGIASFCIADALRVGISKIMAVHPSLVMSVWQEDIGWRSLFAIFTALVSGQAFFVLGGSIWYRNAWIKILAVGYGLQWLLSIVLMAIIYPTFEKIETGSYDFVSYSLHDYYESVIYWTAVAISWVFIVLTYLVAYFRNRENGLNFRW